MSLVQQAKKREPQAVDALRLCVGREAPNELASILDVPIAQEEWLLSETDGQAEVAIQVHAHGALVRATQSTGDHSRAKHEGCACGKAVQTRTGPGVAVRDRMGRLDQVRGAMGKANGRKAGGGKQRGDMFHGESTRGELLKGAIPVREHGLG